MAKKITMGNKTKLPALKESYDGRSLYPWIDIRTAYIEGFQDEEETWIWPTMAQIAKKFSVDEKQVQNRAIKERWTDHRRAHQNQIAVARQQEHAKKLAEKAVKFDADAVATATFANQLIAERLAELQELQGIMLENRQLLIDEVRAGNFVTPGQLKASAISGAELESLAKAFALFNETGRKALGIKEGESAVNLTVNNTEVHQVSIREELTKPDSERAAAIGRLFNNANFTLSQFMGTQQALEAGEDDIEDAEVVDG